MKILRVYTKLPPLPGGMENHVATLSKLQNQKGHNVTICFNEGNPVSKQDMRILKWIKVHRIRPQFIGFFIFHIGVLLKTNRSMQFDYVHLHGDWSSLLFGKLYKKRLGCKRIILSIHDSLNGYPKWKKHLFFRSLQNVDSIYTTGYDAYQLIENKCEAHFQPSGINNYFFRNYNQKKPNIFTSITVCNLVAKKNILGIIKIAERIPDVLFRIIGDGPERKKIEESIKTLGLSNVELIGVLPKKEIPKELQAAELFLFTSYREGTPTVVLEAMASGLPIVASNAGGLNSILKNGINGYIVTDANDIDSYVTYIKLIKKNKGLQDKMKLNNKKKAVQFHWENVTKNIEKIIKISK